MKGMKRRDFLKAILAVPAALAMPFRKKHEVYGAIQPEVSAELKRRQKQRDYPSIDLGPCGSNYGVDQFWVTPAHPDLTTNFQCLIGDNWATIICLPPGNKVHILPVPIWVLEKSFRMRIMYA